MGEFLREEFGVAMSGVKWDIGNYKLWQSTRDGVILFVPRQPVLAKNPENDRYQVAVSQFRAQREGTYQPIGGSAIFTITSAIQFSSEEFERVREAWRNEMAGIGPQPPRNPRFIPLGVRKGKAQVLINSVSGVPNEAHNDQDVGTPGGTNSFLVELTKEGAQEWVQAIKEKSNVAAGVKFSYEYLRMLPPTGAKVRVHGRRLFTHLSSQLKASYGGFLYGGSINLEAEWEKMTRNGDIEITFIGTPPEGDRAFRDELVRTFTEEARQQLFSSLFAPLPEVDPAQAGDTGGLFGGANFALKYKRAEEVTDLNLEIKFEGFTWMKASMDADITTLFAELDNSYVTEVNTEMSFPASVVVDADPVLADVAVSWSASEGKSPEAPVFGEDGGNQVYTVTSANPDAVEIRYGAKVNFQPSNWPVIETGGTGTVQQGGNQVVIKPSSWIGRHMIYMFVHEGQEIKLVGVENDYLVCNVSYEGPHLTNPIKDSAKITPFEPLEFSYPLNPGGARGQAKFSAFGVIGGRLVRAQEQPINFDEEAVFILASRDEIKLVSQASIVPENSLESRLRQHSGRAVIEETDGSGPIISSETTRPGDGALEGTVVGVTFGSGERPMIFQLESGERRQFLVRGDLAEDLERLNEPRRGRVWPDATGKRAENVFLYL